jgi:AraC family transcriptional regulator
MTTAGLIATSRGRGWKGITYDVYGLVTDVEIDTPPVDHHALGYCLEGSGRLWQRRGGRTHESVLRAGSLVVMAAGDPRSWRGTAPASLRIRIPGTLLAEAALETTNNTGRTPELIDVFHTRDLFIGQMASMLTSELDRPVHPAQSLIIESISYALSAHLVRHYDAFRQDEAKVAGLGPRALASVISYIEDHAHESIALDTLAGLANVSRFHFARMFKLSIGVSPMTYVEQGRIRKAQNLIKEGKLSLAAIGMAVGFADQSHFTRRFRLHIGCTPSHYASILGVDRSRLLPRTGHGAHLSHKADRTFETDAGYRNIVPIPQRVSRQGRTFPPSFPTGREQLA